ncbi:hypothetical protein H8S95_02935 [Pontibacter sp. KCTC 32443]|uniref:lipid II flippase MurJ n=1 Tax=Pontibacter TaxID=323449 RepID=UPI00164DB2F7|nr:MULTISPECIES: lipid II flippase MurJ [Pontibacter]MBC5773006.1 hypothetical protein [Pontibacter sp. KCTC 32443]
MKIKQASSTIIFSILINIVSKVIGFVREVFISSQFGSSIITDAFFTLQQVPQGIGNFVQGAFNLSFIPHFHDAEKKGVENKFFKYLFRKLIYLGSAVAIIYFIITQFIYNSSSLELSFSTIFTFAIIPFVIIGLCFGLLNAKEKYLKANLYATLYPVVMLLFLFILPFIGFPLDISLPLSYTIGLVLSSAAGILIFYGIFKRTSQHRSQNDDLILIKKEFNISLFHSTIENIGFNLNSILTVIFLSQTGIIGIVSSNAYSNRISMLFLSGFVGPLNQLFQGYFSKYKESITRKRVIQITLLFLLSLTIIVIVVIVYRYEIVKLVYERGKFNSEDTSHVADFLVPYMLYFLVISLNQYFARIIYAQHLSKIYAYTMLIAYTISNILKPVSLAYYAPESVIWVMVLAEALAIPYFFYLTNIRRWSAN